MKKIRKAANLLLILSLLMGLFCPQSFGTDVPVEVQATAITEPSGPTSGKFGDNITWELEVDPDGRIYSEEEEEAGAVQPTCYKLTLTGTGDMDENAFGVYDLWDDYREVITSVSIGDGITSICDFGMADLCSMKSLTLSDSVASIGYYAFRDAYSLETVRCGSSLKTIGEYAFDGAYSLETIEFKEGLETIGAGAFSRCAALTTVSLPDSLTTIREDAFTYTGLTSITIPQNVSCIEKQAFDGSYKLKEIFVNNNNTHFQAENNVLYEKREDGTPWRALAYALESPGSIALLEGTEVVDEGTFFRANIGSVKFPSTLTSIGNSAFSYCYRLGSVQFSDNLKTIGDQAFCGCYALGSVQFPGSLQTIGNGAFNGCTGLRNVQFSDGLKTIKSTAFIGCQSLQKLEIPDSVTTIEAAAFCRCGSLKEVTIGKGLRGITGVFHGGDSSDGSPTMINTITVDEDNPYLQSIDNVIFTKDGASLCYYASGKPDQEYHVPESVKSLSGKCIHNTNALEKLYLPKTLINMAGDGVIENSNLKSVYAAGNAPTANGFKSNHVSLIIYRIEDSEGWDNAAWKNCTFVIWDPYESLEESGSFGDSVTWLYKGSDKSLVISGSGSVPDFTEEEPAPWNDYKDAIRTIEAKNVTGIGDYGFFHASNLLRLDTGKDLKRIGDYVFFECTELKFIDIPGIDTIGEGAFWGCGSIASILALDKVSSIGAGAFKGCTAIPSVTLGESLTVLAPEVFEGCSSISSMMIPGRVSVIGERALKDCSSLRYINIPAGTTAIGAQAFAGDTALEKVYFYGAIPAEWAQDSFENCSSLTLCYRTSQAGWAELNGNWNNIPLLAQERFYTERQDHYSFGNSASSFGYPAGYHFPKRRYVETLGSITMGTYYYVTEGNWKGSCYGMSGSTLEFYEDPESFRLADYSPSADTLYKIGAPHDKFAALTKLIESGQISQFQEQISGTEGEILKNMGKYREIVWQVEAFERSGGLRVDSDAEPLILTVYSKCRGHAVVPVSVEQDEQGDFQVKVYDSNYPDALQTLTVYKDYSGISYGIYYKASYVKYSDFIAANSNLQTYSQGDPSLYLSIDKEYGMVTDESGKGVDEIEGAYEQKPMTGEEEDVFSGIRSFVLPKGNYQLGTDVPEGADETTNPDSVTFYMGSEDCFAEVSSSDEDATLTVKNDNTQEDELVLELQSDSQTEETSQFTIVNEQGMEKTVEISSGSATVSIGENNEIIIEAPGQESVIIDGQEIELTDSRTESSFIAGPGENPLKTLNLETEITCGQNNKLNGTLDVEVYSNTAEAKEVNVTAEFFENSENIAAVLSEKRTLNPGLNLISLSMEELETAFQEAAGSITLSCRFTVTDENGNSTVLTNDDISVTLTEQTGGNTGDNTGGNTGDNTGGGTTGGNTGDNTGGNTTGGNTGDNTGGGTTGGNTGDNTGGNTTGGNTGDNTGGNTTGGNTGDNTGGNTTGGNTGDNTGGNTTGGNTGDNTGGSSTDKTGDLTDTSVLQKYEVASVKTDVKKLTLGVGETYKLTVSVLPENASDKSLRYTSSNKNVTVNEKGEIKAKKTGSSKIVVTASNGKNTTVKVTVKKKPSKIKLNAKTKSLKVGKTFQIKASFPKGSASRKLTYISSKKSVAIVSSAGKVTARKNGTAIITVRTYNGKKAKLKVIVKK